MQQTYKFKNQIQTIKLEQNNHATTKNLNDLKCLIW